MITTGRNSCRALARLRGRRLGLLMLVASATLSVVAARPGLAGDQPAAVEAEASASSKRSPDSASDWPVHAGNHAGQRYSALTEIDPSNVSELEQAWVYRTGDLRDEAVAGRNHAFQATPILVGDRLIFCTPRSRVVAVDAETGRRLWQADPGVDLSLGHYVMTCRGVASHTRGDLESSADREDVQPICATRIFVATADARLAAYDHATGVPCPKFGEGGEIPFWTGIVEDDNRDEMGISSPPIVVGDVVIVGSSIAESRRLAMPSGRVQAFDALTGEKVWEWDPIPQDPSDPAQMSWAGAGLPKSGGANVWSLASADIERDLVFLPTSSPSPDWFGGARVGVNQHADSVVALRASSGEFVWAFQTVHHDLWDYDVGSQPVLFDLEIAGETLPALAQATKMGHVFILHRETGEPVFPVEERPVPESTVPGEWAAPSQPFPTWPPPLVPQTLGPDEVWGLTPFDRWLCRRALRTLRSEGIFTPPSLEGTVLFPGNAGGSNWGSVAWDPVRKLLIANTSRVANTIQLIPREEADFEIDGIHTISRFEMEGSPYVGRLGVFVSPLGIPCNAPPWGALTAIDFSARSIRWETSLGTTRDLAPVPIGFKWGTPNMGGPLITASGLVFIGAALDNELRAFDIESGELLFEGRLPAGGQATPMTYRGPRSGRQFVVIAAGGHAQMRSTPGDHLIAFALPAEAGAAPPAESTVEPPARP